MLNNAYEWERLIHPNPTDEMVTRRKAIVADVLSSFDTQKDVKNGLCLATAALTGLSPKVSTDVTQASTLIETTKKHHAAFSSLLSENALDLQLTACLAIGELLHRKPSKGAWTDARGVLAAVSLSASGLLPPTNGAHLKAVQGSLQAAARECLARSAKQVRQRPEYSLDDLDELSPPADIPGFWNELKPILMTALEAVSRTSEIDRDELEVLWWLYNAESITFAKPLSEIGPYDLAFAAPIELIDRAMCPAPSSLNAIVQGLISRADQRSSGQGRALKSVIGTWGIDAIKALVPDSDEGRECVAASPKALPLSWIAIKVADAGVTGGWEQEFTSRTGLNANSKITAKTLADQTFAERTAQRLLFQLIGE
jgi:hypothetical protein